MAHTPRIGRFAATVAFSLTSLLVPGTASAAEIYACVHKSSEQVRFVAATVACGSNAPGRPRVATPHDAA